MGPNDLVLMRAWAKNLRGKARMLRKGVRHMDESCDDLARIIEEYVASVTAANQQAGEGE